MVLATQNPIEQEGTYPLPEAQMDRFLMHITMTHPDDASEKAIIRLVRGETSGQTPEQLEIIPQDAVFSARKEINQVSRSWMKTSVVGFKSVRVLAGHWAWIKSPEPTRGGMIAIT